MRNLTATVCFTLTIGLGLLINPGENQPLPQALRMADRQFRADLSALVASAADYRAGAEAGVPVDSLRTLHLRTRRHLKEAEYLLAFLEPAAFTLYLNGAPLPKLEPNVPEVTVQDPIGLQVLDEVVFADSPDYAELTRLTRRLQRDLEKTERYLSGLRLEHRHVFEGMREEVIRIYTLGITGFDTPGSVAALPESGYALRRMERIYGGYRESIAALEPELDATIRRALRLGGEQLAGADFTAFDRLTFLREVTDPLLAALPRAQRLLGIETAGDAAHHRLPVNPVATSLFAENFLNADYYARLERGPLDAERRALGERLFFDPLLSEGGDMSCASCHRPELAFTDGEVVSVRRNAPTLVNSVYASAYFYDLREDFLDRQARHVIFDTDEFATDPVRLTERLGADPTYRTLFATAYADQPDYALSNWSIGDALARYVSSLQNFDSPFDRYARGETDRIDPAVRRGYNLFMGKAACGSCHFPPTFSGLLPPYYRESESEVLGVPATAVWSEATVDPDPGRMVSGRPRDEAYFYAFSFKTPTVRNAALTAPYMHNGVYRTLEEVVKFYNLGGGKGIGIDLEHQTLPFDSLGLTAGESADLVTFMESLTAL